MRWKRIAALFVLTVFLIIPTHADAHGVVNYNKNSNVVQITCTGLDSNSTYTVILREGLTDSSIIPVTNIQFIDQVMTNDSGRLDLAFIQMNLPECSVFLGGGFMDGVSPKKIGELSLDGQSWSAMLPSSLRVIEDYAFEDSAFTHVYIGDQVTCIGSGAFKNCTGLLQIRIPDSVTEIGTDAFSGCDDLVILCGENSAALRYAQDNDIAYQIV